MNQIINMVMRMFMRKMVSKGIDAGFKKASSMRGKSTQPQGEIDDFGNPVQSQSDVRAARRAQRQGGDKSAQQAEQAMKMLRRAGKP
jgi:hypothetical protein